MTHNEFTKAYEREGHLGGGGFGQVFKAYDIENDRYVAIKRSEVKPEFKDFTLMREYELAKEIPAHINICPYEICHRFSEGFIDADYAILKYYEYGNISNFLEKQTLSDREKKQLIKGILQGVGHLHNNNIIHRDLKAGNILMDREDGVWRPKIADFGLSKVIDKKQLTKSLHNSSIGVSFHYAAPEQIIGDSKILPNVDLWAVGVLIYQVITNGRLPFTSDHPDNTKAQTEIAKKVASIILPSNLQQIEEPYLSIIKKCWVKDIHQRVQNAGELIEILNHKTILNQEQTIIENHNDEFRENENMITIVCPKCKKENHAINDFFIEYSCISCGFKETIIKGCLETITSQLFRSGIIGVEQYKTHPKKDIYVINDDCLIKLKEDKPLPNISYFNPNSIDDDTNIEIICPYCEHKTWIPIRIAPKDFICDSCNSKVKVSI